MRCHAELMGCGNRRDLGIRQNVRISMLLRACHNPRVGSSGAGIERQDALAE